MCPGSGRRRQHRLRALGAGAASAAACRHASLTCAPCACDADTRASPRAVALAFAAAQCRDSRDGQLVHADQRAVGPRGQHVEVGPRHGPRRGSRAGCASHDLRPTPTATSACTTAAAGTGRASAQPCVSDDGRSWTKHAGNPIWGGGGSGVNARTNDGGQPWVAVVGGVYWLFTTTNCCGTGCSPREHRDELARRADLRRHTDARVPFADGATYYGNASRGRSPTARGACCRRSGRRIWQIYLYGGLGRGGAWRLLN